LRALEGDGPDLFEESDIGQVIEQAPETHQAPSPDRPAKRRRRSSSDDPDAASFERFYDAYPRHVAKGNAEKAYRRIIAHGEATPDQLLAGAMRYAAERQGQDQQYTKYPATWLNGKCWLDEAAPPRSPVRNSLRQQVLEGARRAMETMIAAESEARP
jgi:hypothetical protein